ncbi:MAG: hypothetical protein L0Z54_01265 [Thermoplasmata archaeon]|nr:hypothetical protein [Thermoplasmata archaeon]
MADPLWVYVDRIRRRATVHRATCPYCNDGKGFHHLVSGRVGGEWSGPFFSPAEAMSFASGTGRPLHMCSRCMGNDPWKGRARTG